MIADKKTRHRNKPNRMSNVEMTVLMLLDKKKGAEVGRNQIFLSSTPFYFMRTISDYSVTVCIIFSKAPALSRT